MKELTFFKIGFCVMILLNILILAVLLSPFPPRPGMGRHPFQKKIITHLQLDKNQESTFLQLASDHDKEISSRIGRQKKAIDQYFIPLYQLDNLPSNDSLLNTIGILENEKIKLTYTHFQEVKQILTLEQKRKFSPILSEALTILLETRRTEK